MHEAIDADVVVIGAGFAGLSAAVRLADAGKRVVVLEVGPRLGGRASTFTDPATGERVDNGQHVLFGCYRETYAFLKRLGTQALAPPERTLCLSMVAGDGRLHTLTCPRLPAPWHLLAGVLKWDAVRLSDRLLALGIVRAIRRYRSTDGAPGLQAGGARVTVTQWLQAHGQSPELRRWLWNPLAFAALNQSPDVAAAEPFIRVLQELFGPRAEDSAIAMPVVPLDELYALPAARFIAEHGGDVRTKSPARLEIRGDGRVVAIRADASAVTSKAVVSAVPWHAFARLWHGRRPAELETVCAAAERMTPSPIVTVNLWFDRPVTDRRFVGLTDAAMHWAFDKASIFGVREGHLSMVSSGAEDLVAMENSHIVDVALRDLHAALVATRTARVTRSQVVREHRATFSLAPGQPARPAVKTPIPGFVIAGDWTDTGLPSTIEGAVRSGHAAADELLRT